MGIDLTGGLDRGCDLHLAERPADPECRESASFWISDDQGRFGFPRVCIEAVGAGWETHGNEINLAFPDGRVFIGHGPGAAHPAIAADGQPRVLGAGPLKFETLEPFRKIRVTFDGEMRQTTVADQARRVPPGPARRVRFEFDCEPAAPPFIPGTLSKDARQRMASGPEARAMVVGGFRFEQLVRSSGRLDIDGEPERAFTGSGLRIQRVSVRNTGEFFGHCWLSALFPSGKGFGCQVFAPKADGVSAYNEAYIFDGTELIPARAIEAPWLTSFEPLGGAVDLTLETEAGQRVRIEGRNHVTTCVPPGESMFGDWPHGHASKLFFHQGGVRYTWDGEETFGMIERSLPGERVSLALGDS